MTGCLIIHGYTGGPYEIEPLITHVQKNTDWQIEAPVLKGHGRELDLTDVAFEGWLADTEKVLQKLMEECDKVYIIGFSMGGMIAAYLAAKYKIEKLVLLAPARRYISFKYMANYVREIIGDGIKGKLQENEVFMHYKDKMGDIPLKANVEFMKLVAHTKPYLEQITAPVFIAQGQKDGLVPFKMVYALEEEIGSERIEVVLFENSDHHICLGEDSGLLNKMVLNFLTSTEEKSNGIIEK